MLVLDLNMPIVNEECKEDRKKILISYFQENLRRHNFYAFRFFICEALNFVNVVGQIYFMDYFLDGEFSTYGSDVLRFTEMEPEMRGDPMSRVFPKVSIFKECFMYAQIQIQTHVFTRAKNKRSDSIRMSVTPKHRNKCHRNVQSTRHFS